MSQGIQPSNDKEYKCTHPGCTKAEARKNDLDDHIFVVHKGGKYTCPHCSSSFLRKRTNVSHIKVKHEGQKKCHCKVENCSWSDNDYGKLIGHMFSVHNVDTELKCMHCNKVFQNERSYEYHIIHAHEAKQFQCSKCKRWFKLKSKLEEHWNKYHKDEIPKFMCHICGHSFSDKKNMDAHVKNHSKEDESKANILNTIDNALNKGAGESSQLNSLKTIQKMCLRNSLRTIQKMCLRNSLMRNHRRNLEKVVKLLGRVSLVCSQRNTLTIWFS